MKKLQKRHRAKVEMHRSEESLSRRSSCTRPAEEMEEERSQDRESSTAEEGLSQQDRFAPSDQTYEVIEDSLQGLEEMQVGREDSSKPSLNQESVGAQEEEEEEEVEEEEGKGKEEEEEENPEEEEAKEEQESWFVWEVGQQLVLSWVRRKFAAFILCVVLI